MSAYRYVTDPEPALWYHPDPVRRPALVDVTSILTELRAVSSLDDHERQAAAITAKDALVAELAAADDAQAHPIRSGQLSGLALSATVLDHYLRGPTSPLTVAAFALSEPCVALANGIEVDEHVIDNWLEQWLRPPAPPVGTPPVDPTTVVAGRDPAPAAAVIEPTLPPAGDQLVADSPAASAVVAACEQAWKDIQARHPDVPDVVMVLGTGVEHGRLSKLGHYWGGQWITGERVVGEVLLAGEALHLPAGRVFEVLLHEAAHGRNAARGIKDTSRQGRYHNQQFKTTAQDLGLRVRPMPPYGWASTALRPETVDAYQPAIDRIADAVRIARTINPNTLDRTVIGGKTGAAGTLDGGQAAGADRGARRTGQRVTATCGCDRRFQIAPTVLQAGPVICGTCHTEFTAPGVERKAPDPVRIEPRQAAHPIDAHLEHALTDLGYSTGQVRAARVAAWYSQPDPREPMVSPPGERARDVLEARRLLAADGTLTGPYVDLDDGLPIQAGDRLVATALETADRPVPPGALATVTRVDRNRPGTITLDVATETELSCSLQELRAGGWRHDYAAPTIDPPTVALAQPF